MGKLSTKEKLPKIFYVNWFRKNKDGQYLWPGYGENIRVLKWIFERLDNKDNVIKTRIGYLPDLNEFDLSGLNIDIDQLNELFCVDDSEWQEEINSIREHYQLYGELLPKELKKQLQELEKRMQGNIN